MPMCLDDGAVYPGSESEIVSIDNQPPHAESLAGEPIFFPDRQPDGLTAIFMLTYTRSVAFVRMPLLIIYT